MTLPVLLMQNKMEFSKHIHTASTPYIPHMHKHRKLVGALFVFFSYIGVLELCRTEGTVIVFIVPLFIIKTFINYLFVPGPCGKKGTSDDNIWPDLASI